jgi:hypothetical protein
MLNGSGKQGLSCSVTSYRYSISLVIGLFHLEQGRLANMQQIGNPLLLSKRWGTWNHFRLRFVARALVALVSTTPRRYLSH